jgi:hypothetical protein
METLLPEDLSKWLRDSPANWVQVIAARAALRAMPLLLKAEVSWLNQHALSVIRANLISWLACNFPVGNASNAAFLAARADIYGGPDVVRNTYRLALRAVDAVSRHESTAGQRAALIISPSLHSVYKESLTNIDSDRHWLENHDKLGDGAEQLTREPLWLAQSPESYLFEWQMLIQELIIIDPNYDAWIAWYYRRIRGEDAAFDIPGDKGRKEDKNILRRLAEATDEDFWGKGHEYVNATLKDWLEEARARVAPPEIESETQELTEIEVPPPVSGATTYGLSSEGKLDPLPHYDQEHLRDLPNQRRAYADMRGAALELQAEGQRLGPKLLPKLDRFVDAITERFEDAEAWPIWSAAAALRTLYWKHKAVAENPEPDDAKLDPAVAVELRGFLDIYNVFAFGDDGLRQKDENSISPQERLKAEELAKLSQPIEQAIIETPAVRTEAALQLIQEHQDNVALTAGTPYGDQALDQANKNIQNVIAGYLSGVNSILSSPYAIGAEHAKQFVKRSADVAVITVCGVIYSVSQSYLPLIELVAFNADHLKTYVAAVHHSYQHLPEMIDRIKLIWQRLTSKV